MKKRLYLWEKALLCALCFTFLLQTVAFCAAETELRERVLRLHVIASSNSEADQALKLQVRDRILQECAAFLEGVNGKEEAACRIEENRESLIAAAEACVRENGFDYAVAIRTERCFFPGKVYGDMRFPAGFYDGVRVEIGEAAGKNWWCVIFPGLCLPAAEEETALQGVLTEEEMKLLRQEGGYKLGFMASELFERLRTWLGSGKE